MNSESDPTALARLIRALQAKRYSFITPTPETHARIVGRRDWREAKDLRGIFGWNLPFHRDVVDDELWRILGEGGLLGEAHGLWRSTLRVASLGEHLFLHTGFPPGADSVFFGPDTYRFAKFLIEKLEGIQEAKVLVDLGAGSGAGAVIAAESVRTSRVILSDVNPHALTLARVNLNCAGLTGEFRLGDALKTLPEFADLIVANPPFIASSGRTYSEGGDLHGGQVSLDWTVAGAQKLNSGGRMLLYTGAAIIDGVAPLHEALLASLDPALFDLIYEELDPDIFGETLEHAAYSDVERIAAVGVQVVRRTHGNGPA